MMRNDKSLEILFAQKSAQKIAKEAEKKVEEAQEMLAALTLAKEMAEMSPKTERDSKKNVEKEIADALARAEESSRQAKEEHALMAQVLEKQNQLAAHEKKEMDEAKALAALKQKTEIISGLSTEIDEIKKFYISSVASGHFEISSSIDTPPQPTYSHRKSPSQELDAEDGIGALALNPSAVEETKRNFSAMNKWVAKQSAELKPIKKWLTDEVKQCNDHTKKTKELTLQILNIIFDNFKQTPRSASFTEIIFITFYLASKYLLLLQPIQYTPKFFKPVFISDCINKSSKELADKFISLGGDPYRLRNSHLSLLYDSFVPVIDFIRESVHQSPLAGTPSPFGLLRPLAPPTPLALSRDLEL